MTYICTHQNRFAETKLIRKMSASFSNHHFNNQTRNCSQLSNLSFNVIHVLIAYLSFSWSLKQTAINDRSLYMVISVALFKCQKCVAVGEITNVVGYVSAFSCKSIPFVQERTRRMGTKSLTGD